MTITRWSEDALPQLSAVRAEAAHQQRRLGRAAPYADLFPGTRAGVALAMRECRA